MRTKGKLLVCAVCVLGLLDAAGAATWTNAYPWSVLWRSPQNWDPPIVPGALDEAYINPPGEQGPVIDSNVSVMRILGPRFDSNSNQTMYIVYGTTSIAENWEFGDSGSGTSTIYIDDDAHVIVGADILHRSGEAEIYVGGTARVTVGNQIHLAQYGSAILDMAGDANSSVNVEGDLRAGDTAGSWFEARISGGSLSTGGDFYVGPDGSGIFDISGGSVTAASFGIICNPVSSTGTINISGDAHVDVEQMQVCVGNGTGTLNISGGEVNTGELSLGGSGSGTLDMTGGILVVDGAFNAPNGTAGSVTIDLEGGAIECGSFVHAGSYTMDINEGVLIIDGDVTDVITADVNAGYINMYNPDRELIIDYGVINPGRTTVWARPYEETVPDVVGIDQVAAEATIEAIGFPLGSVVEQYDNNVPEGVVISQHPLAGTVAPITSAVDLVVSLGQPLVPGVIGDTLAEATATIEAVDNLTVGVVSWLYSNTVPYGIVTSQYPVSRTPVPLGSSIDLVLSLGPPVVPGVVGMTLANATTTIEAVDSLTVGNVSLLYTNNIAAGVVFGQSPIAGTTVSVGSTIDLMVSLGRPVVPPVIGLTVTSATNAIEAVDNLTVGTILYSYSNSISAGLVMNQIPAAGTAVDTGSSITLVLSLGRPVVPNVVGQATNAAIASIEAVDDLAASVSYQFHNTLPSGTVISQSPTGGATVDVGSTINLIVSLGRPIVPNVVGQSEASAVSTIEAIGYLVASVTYQYHNTIPASIVISQDPSGGTPVDTGSTVNLVVSLGRPIVPNVVGMAETSAVATIETVDGFTATATYEYHNSVPLGVVISQNPAGDTSVDIGTVVSIVVSLGRPVVPEVVGMILAEAVAAVEAVDNLTTSTTHEYHNSVPAGVVISQDPVAGTDVDVATTVSLVVSLGRPVVPNVVGMVLAEARDSIETIDSLTVSVSYQYHNTVPEGDVISQDPTGGTSVDVGTVVAIVVSLGRPIVPDVVGMSESAATLIVEGIDSLTVSAAHEYHNSMPAGKVISQNPTGGTAVDVGTTVDILVSLGRPIVPNVAGMTLAEATTTVEGVDNLTVSATYEYHNSVPVGKVISQDPGGGTAVDVGTNVNVVVSLGRPVVPNVVGMDQGSAVTAIEAVDSLSVSAVYEYHNAVPAGTVIIQLPTGGTSVDVGTTVEILVSLGRPVVPSVFGLPLSDAQDAIEAVDNLTVSVTYQYHNTVPTGVVISQDPAADTEVDIGTTINLVVSLGRPVVPSVVGMSLANATIAIESVDNLSPVVTYQYHNSVPSGVVISQVPTGGTAVDVGTVINIVVSLGRPVVPDVVGMSLAEATTEIESVDNLNVSATYEYHNSVPTGDVVSQSPAGGASVNVGMTVDVVVSLGRPIVPDVEGIDEAAAIAAIEAVDSLAVSVSYEYHNTVPTGLVISQNPPGNTAVNIGTIVNIVVSVGRPTVPNVVGVSLAAATSLIEAIDNLVVDDVTEQYDNIVGAGLVMSQNPSGGSVVDVGTSVDLVVSLGRPTVPNVIGQSEADAIAAIEAVDTLSAALSHEYHNSVAAGSVISQDPAGGSKVNTGTVVSVVVSLGRPIVPAVVGLTEAAASAAIEGIDNLAVAVSYENHSDVPQGRVVSQDPAGGTAVDIATTVSIVVSMGQPVVPHVVGFTQAAATAAITSVDNLAVSVTFEYNDEILSAIVISQTPAGGTPVGAGATVDIVVSLGPPTLMMIGSDRLVELQNDDGGWDDPLDDGNPAAGSDSETFASVALGMAMAFRETPESSAPDILAALGTAKTLLLSKTNDFSTNDAALAIELDAIFETTQCSDYVRANFYEKLTAGTYYDSRNSMIYDTVSYIQALRNRRDTEGQANLAAWDVGVGLYNAHVIGADTTPWIAAVKTEIEELNDADGFDVLGLAGAVLGLAAVGEDYDPQDGAHASASSLSDLVDTLAGYQLGTGGFTWHAIFQIENLDESVLETVYGIAALVEFDRTAYSTSIIDAGVYLQSVQLETGGWENYTYAGENNRITGQVLSAIVQSFPIVGDFNNDGHVNFEDYAIFAAAWRSAEGQPSWNLVCDINIPADRLINLFDFAVFIDNWLGSSQ